MFRFKWMMGLAFFVWSCAWLHGPAFQASAQDVKVATAVSQIRPQTAERKERFPTTRESSEPLRVTPMVRKKVAKAPSLSQTTNLLVLGLDKKPGEKGVGRPDTLVVAAFSPSTNQLGLISVPRDLYVELEGHGPDRINAAYSVALRTKQDPAQLTKRVIEATLSLPIHHTLSLDLGAFEELVDSVGGVEVHVSCPISDNFLDPRTDSGRRLLNLETGVVHMNGITAGLYARSRHGRSDLSRARRQQAILLGLKRRVLSSDGLTHVGVFLSTLSRYVRSDISRADMLALGSQAARLEAQDIHGLVLGYREAAPTIPDDGKQVLVPNDDAIQLALSRLFSAPAPGSEPEGARCPSKDAALARGN